eukprot:333398_1
MYLQSIQSTIRHLASLIGGCIEVLYHWIFVGTDIVDDARFVATEALIYGHGGAAERTHATINTNQHINGPIRIACKVLLDAMLSIIIGNKIVTNQHEFRVL